MQERKNSSELTEHRTEVKSCLQILVKDSKNAAPTSGDRLGVSKVARGWWSLHDLNRSRARSSTEFHRFQAAFDSLQDYGMANSVDANDVNLNLQKLLQEKEEENAKLRARIMQLEGMITKLDTDVRDLMAQHTVSQHLISGYRDIHAIWAILWLVSYWLDKAHRETVTPRKIPNHGHT